MGDEEGTTPNDAVLKAYEEWKNQALQGLQKFEPDGLFVGLGFDLHMLEERINDKRKGIGLSGKHYHEILEGLSASCPCGPVVLTLEGGYTKAAVKQGMKGTLAGMVAFSQKRKRHKNLQIIKRRSLSVIKRPSAKTSASHSTAKKLRLSLGATLTRSRLCGA